MQLSQRRFWIGLIGVSLLAIFVPLFAQDAGAAAQASKGVFNWGIVFAAIGTLCATFMGGCGSAVGLCVSGEAATGALSEDPGKFGIIFPIQALPGTQGIYGLLIGFLIYTKISDASVVWDVQKGMYALMTSLPVGIACLVSGYTQGVASAAAIQLVSRKPAEFGKAIITPALIETYAVFGLLMSFMMWLQIH